MTETAASTPSASTPTYAAGAALPPALADIDPASLVLLLDVDGVLAPIVNDPAAAAVPESLQQLVASAVDRCALVGIVTGRGLERAQEMIPLQGAWYAALHGVHIVAPDGAEDIDEIATAGRAHVEIAAQLAQTVGWAYEDKGATVTIHFRQRGNLGQNVDPAHVRAQLQTVLNPLKTEIHDAKQVLEIKPKGMRNKGDAVRVLVGAAPDTARTVVYVGDDLTDLDAFRTIDDIRGEQPVPAVAAETALRFVKTAIGGDEAPADLVASADVIVDGQDGVEPLLRALLRV